MNGELIERGSFWEGKSMGFEKEIPSFDLQRHHAKISAPKDLKLRDMSKKYLIFPLKLIQWNGSEHLVLAMRNPKDRQVILEVELRTGLNVLPVQADAMDIEWLIQKYYYGRQLTPRPSLRPREFSHLLFETLLIQADILDNSRQPFSN